MTASVLRRIGFHAARWVWVLGLGALTVAAFPRGGRDVAPFLEAGDVADRDVVAPFSFVVSKSDEEVAGCSAEGGSVVGFAMPEEGACSRRS